MCDTVDTGFGAAQTHRVRGVAWTHSPTFPPPVLGDMEKHSRKHVPGKQASLQHRPQAVGRGVAGLRERGFSPLN